ncbi:MAG: ABC transporter substrate-binding protein [Ilumatobacteraceae bacterium]
MSTPITGPLSIVAAVPLSGGVAAAQWKPVIDGFRTAIDFANFTHALGDLRLQLTLVDDRFDPDRTVDAIQPELDKGAQVVAAIAGTADNLAARFTLNEQCIPQLLGLSPAPQLGDVADFPWTTGALPSVAAEVATLGTLVRAQLPGGGTLGVYASADDLGDAYVAAAKDTATTSGLSVVATEQVADDATLPASAQIAELVAARPDVVLAAPIGLDCTYFLRELAIQRTAASDWQPVVLVSNGCASEAILGLAGPSADGVYSTANLLDIGNQANASVPGVSQYETWMAGAGLTFEAEAATPGWTVGETLVAIIRQAMAAPGGLSRASIIEAARALDIVPSLGRTGVRFRTNGVGDPFLAQSLQVIRWSAPTRGFVEVGPVITDFES